MKGIKSEPPHLWVSSIGGFEWAFWGVKEGQGDANGVESVVWFGLLCSRTGSGSGGWWIGMLTLRSGEGGGGGRRRGEEEEKRGEWMREEGKKGGGAGRMDEVGG